MRKTVEAQNADVQLISRAVGPLPLLNAFLQRLKMGSLLEQFVPATDRRVKLAPAVGLSVLLRNILLAREPLYGMAEWAQRFDAPLLGLPPEAMDLFNDDRIGRCLDALFLADRAALMTAIVVQAVRTFELDLSELHNDSTTVTFSGEYAEATGQPRRGRPTHRIHHGHNKDHRPDLKQLLFVLTTTADGSVPIWANVDHGNTRDDVTHIATWDTLRQLTGAADFLYVADSKLCSAGNLGHIARHGGRFVTVMPATWREHATFHEWLLTHEVPWIEVLRRNNARRQDGPPQIYRGFEQPLRTAQGFRILWILSSQKEALDRSVREQRIATACKDLEAISARIGRPHSRLMSVSQVTEAAQKVLQTTQTQRFILIEVKTVEEAQFAQAKPGRPGPKTTYVRQPKLCIFLHWQSNAQAVLDAARSDGIFPLIVNDENLSIEAALLAYKHQPALEKRYEQFKSVLAVRPMMLKSHSRIEAFLFLYFIALLTEALIERQTRLRMKELKIDKLPIYPEARLCAAPTTQRLFYLFEDLRRHRLVGADLRVQQRFYDTLSEPQRLVLRLLEFPASQYMLTDEESPPPRPRKNFRPE